MGVSDVVLENNSCGELVSVVHPNNDTNGSGKEIFLNTVELRAFSSLVPSVAEVVVPFRLLHRILCLLFSLFVPIVAAANYSTNSPQSRILASVRQERHTTAVFPIPTTNQDLKRLLVIDRGRDKRERKQQSNAHCQRIESPWPG